jgi:hypothetical protein
MEESQLGRKIEIPELLGRINHLLSFDTAQTACKETGIRCRGNVLIKQLDCIDRGIHIQTHRLAEMDSVVIKFLQSIIKIGSGS